MSFKFTSAHSSRIKKTAKAPSLSRSSSSPFSSLPRRKPIQRSSSKPSTQDGNEDEDEYDRLDDHGLIHALATDLTLRDVAQAIKYIRHKMWTPIPEERSGMGSVKIAEVLNFRSSLPEVVGVAHVQALLDSATQTEREIVELCQKGVIRKIVISSRGGGGEVLILVSELEKMVQKSAMEEEVKGRFLQVLRENPTSLKLNKGVFGSEDAKALMHAGFLTTSTPTWTSTEVFSTPGEGSRGTMTSLNSISKAASGSLAAVGGEGAVHAAGGSGGGIRSQGPGDFDLALPATGSYLKLVASARAHLLSLLSKSKYREAPQSLLRQRWEGGISLDDKASEARRNRREFDGVLPGRTRKWKSFYGMGFEWILGECVGAGMVEVFDTGSIGRGVRAL